MPFLHEIVRFIVVQSFVLVLLSVTSFVSLTSSESPPSTLLRQYGRGYEEVQAGTRGFSSLAPQYGRLP
jgi:hypothetical protein